MKQILSGLLLITSVISMAQAKLGMGVSFNFSPSDSVLVNTTVTLTTVVKNKGNATFNGTYTLNIALNNGTITPVTSSVNTASLNANDSIFVITTFTAQTAINGWRVAGNGNTIVVWPISTSIQTIDSLNAILTVYEPNGILDLEKEIFTMYPNPTKDVLYIKSNATIRFDDYTIYDIEARQIETGKYRESILIKDLPKGLYWLVLSNNETRFKQKFIKE